MFNEWIISDQPFWGDSYKVRINKWYIRSLFQKAEMKMSSMK